MNFDLSLWTVQTSASWIWLLATSFLAGILISFTPCVYPMIPVTAAIMQRYKAQSLVKTVLRSVVYILGIALVYALFGYVSATTKLLFGSWMQSPIVVGLLLLFYWYCAGAMFEWYDLYIPPFFTQQQGFTTNDSLFGLFLYGLLTGTFASPCITPGLALILGVVSQLQNPLLGFMMLFVFALGMSFLLLLISFSAQFARQLPHAGQWMLEVKKIFGFLLIAITFPFIERWVPGVLYQGLIGLFLAIIILFYSSQLFSRLALMRKPMTVPVSVVDYQLHYVFIAWYCLALTASGIALFYHIQQFLPVLIL